MKNHISNTVTFTKQAIALAKMTGIEFPTDLINTLIQASNREIAEHNEKIRMENQRIASGINFELVVIFNPQPGRSQKNDIIPLEGLTNAITVFSDYRKRAFSIGLYSITLKLDDKAIKSIKFTY